MIFYDCDYRYSEEEIEWIVEVFIEVFYFIVGFGCGYYCSISWGYRLVVFLKVSNWLGIGFI